MADLGFANAQKMHDMHPDTFWAPSPEELDGIAAGDFVKVCLEAAKERFWCKVATVTDVGLLDCTVDNELLTAELSLGDSVVIHRDEVYGIMKAGQ